MYVTKVSVKCTGYARVGGGGMGGFEIVHKNEMFPFKFPSAQPAQYKSYIYSQLFTSSLRDPWALHAARPVETAKKEIARTKRSSDSISCKLNEWVDLLHIDHLDPFCGGFFLISC